MSSTLAGDALRRLVLAAYRNHADLALAPDKRFIGLCGPNGAGKTNVLEAISLLAPGRSLRGATLDEIGRVGDPRPWSVFAEVDGAAGVAELGVSRDGAGDGPGRRVVRIDGASAGSPTAFQAHLHQIWLTPAMDRLFAESPGGRRRFLDRLVFGVDPGHAARVSAYEKAMRERARLLKDGARDPAWLGALERRMAETGVAIAAARRDWLARMDAAAPPSGPFPRARLALDGRLESALDAAPALAVEERYAADLAAARARDGDASPGPHRTDLKAWHGATDAPAERCSTGEQKAILASVILTAARLSAMLRGRGPLILLDDVAAHFDAERRDALFGALDALRAQCWITATERSVFAALGGAAAIYDIAPGAARAAI